MNLDKLFDNTTVKGEKLPLHMSNNLYINLAVLELFTLSNKISAARVYFYAKLLLNNNIHKSDHDKICEDLGISNATLRRCLSQLASMSIGKQISKNYFRIYSWKTFVDVHSNKSIQISMNDLKSIKKLRTLFYYSKYRSAYYCAKQNKAANDNELMKWVKPKHIKSQMPCGYLPVSSSFVQDVTGVQVSKNTLLIHLRRANSFNYCKSINQRIVHFYSESLDQVKAFKASMRDNKDLILGSSSYSTPDFNAYSLKDSNYLVNLSYSTLKIRKFQGKFFLLSYFPNLIKVSSIGDTFISE